MTITMATISGAFVRPDLGTGAMTVYIEAATEGSRLTSGGTVIAGKYGVQVDAAGNASVTIPQLPQASILPADARWRLVQLIGNDTYKKEFTLSVDTTWGALTDVSGTPITSSILQQAQAARDAAAASAASISGVTSVTWTADLSVRNPLYGATGNGTTDDTTAIQNAINAAATSISTLRVVVPGGTYSVTNLQVKTGVELYLAPGATIQARGTTAGDLITVIGDHDSWVTGNGTIDVNARTNSIGVNFSPTSGTGTRVGIRGCTVINATNNAIRWLTGKLIRGLTVEDCTIDTCTNGISVYSFTGQVQRDIRIARNTITNTGTNNIQTVGNNPGEFMGVLISDNRIHDFQQVGANGPVPIEVGYCTGVVVRGNYIGALGTRGISTGRCTDMVIADNTVIGQSIYAVEINVGQRLSITGNVFRDCATWINETGAQAEDVTIAGNTFVGTGLSSTLAGGNGIKLAIGPRRVRITGNLFSDWPYLGNAVLVGQTNAAEDVVVEGNTFICNDANSTVQAVQVRKAIRSSVRNNVIRIKRNLVAGDDITDSIQVALDAASSDILIEGNEVFYAGTTSAAANSSGIGHGSTGAATFPGFVVRRNRIKAGARGLRLGSVSSGDCLVEDNDTRTCTAADNLNAATIFRRTVRYFDGTAAPTTGTWVKGDRVENSNPAVGSPKGWICTVAGTPGTWVSTGNL